MMNGIMDGMNREIERYRSDGRFARSVSLAAFVAVLVFAAMSVTMRGYRADVTVLVISRTSASDAQTIAEDTALLSRTDGFRTLFLSDADTLPATMTEESLSDLSGDERRAVAERMLSVSSDRDAGRLIVTGFAEDADDARAISRSGALSLFRYASKYYDVRTEVDFRIVDGPAVSGRYPSFWVMLAGSLVAGVAVSALIAGIFGAEKRRRLPNVPMSFSAEMFLPKRPVSPILTEDDGKEIGPSTPLEPVSPVVAAETSDEVPDEAAEDDFFEPKPSSEPELLRSADSADRSAKKAPAPLDIPTFSEEEARFLKEFSFEQPDVAGMDLSEDKDAADESDAATREAVPSMGDSSIRKELVSKEEEAAPDTAPSREEYLKRLNELLRG